MKTPILRTWLVCTGLIISRVGLSQDMAYVRATPNSFTNQQKAPTSQKLKDVLLDLGRKYEVSIIFEESTIQGIVIPITNSSRSGKIEQRLERILEPNGLEFKKAGASAFVVRKKEVKAKLEKEALKTSGLLPTAGSIPLALKESEPTRIAEVVVKGKITDEKNEGLPGVSILVKGSNKGTVSDMNGNFSIDVGGPNAILVFSYIGYETKEVAVGQQSNIMVRLTENISSLSEVMVVGYGTQKRGDITGSIGSLSAKNIKEIQVTNFENAIQGQIAGVQVQEPSGEPGAATTIRVRGLGSVSAGNEPLYVIDGFPVTKNMDPGIQGDITRRTTAFALPASNPLGTINPNDIESIEVLKDASAAAIYGSRGSNGVILITTKKGKRSSKPVIGFDAYFGIQSIAKKVDLMNAAELTEYVYDSKNNAYLQDIAGANINDDNATRYTKTTNGSYYIPDDFANPDGTDTDWQKLIFHSAPVQSYNASVSGGNETMNYYFSGGYFNQKGIIDRSGFERYSFRANLEASPVKKLKVGFGLSPSFTNTQRSPAGAPYFADPPGIVYSALVHSPTVKPYLADGTINQTDNQSHLLTSDGRGANMTAASNPLAIINYVTDDLRQFRVFGNLFAEYEILSGLKYKIYTGVDVNSYNRSFYMAKAFLNRTATSGDPYAQSNASLNYNWLVENTVSYDKSFGKAHNVSAVIGYSAQKDRLDANQVYAQNHPDDLSPTISGGQVTSGGDNRQEWSLVSALARVNYSYMDKYLITATIRSDRSSRFGAGNKTGTFPSFSAGWRLSEESFMKGITFVSDIKLRGSWGKTGNFLIPNYASIGLLSPYNYVLNNVLVNGIAPVTINNEKLTWEKTTQVDIGLDFGLFRNRLSVSADWYNKTTSDLLLNVQVPASVGFLTALQNIGKVENKGVELTLSSRNLVGEFTWTTDLNISSNKNKVLKLGPTGDPILSSGGAGIRHITQIGAPIGSYYGYVVEGIYQTQAEVDAAPDDALAPSARPGDFRFKDVNGDGKIDADDRTVTGNYLPDYIWGITNRFGFKGFDMSIFFQGVQGSEILNLTRRHLGNGEAATNSYADWTERWRSVENPGNGEIPRADRLTDLHGGNTRPSSFQVEDGSYFRLRSVSMGYTFPKSLLGSRIQSLRAYASATNLFTSTKYIGFNPEVNNQAGLTGVQGEDYGAYPLSRNFTFGLNVTF
ncbi:TonB-linked SusC/RagA family outer membrane protein [Dyadobacter jejuensis]|uniref:TonB-linked SusC/RagA family outer membrane protein n=1 Tax=Dyadobacter jejuensis TaxID=1082580 RepID=A0A316AM55_9BACT|nr:TonB-dependent receptor [Dyadobacter jejuensis]PWJ58651.1 TonB-linked SusC/RagA family outer membrane protein [Dyadobacter jejuensis]